MSNTFNRREALVLITGAAFLTPALAQHAHEEVAKSLAGGAAYQPKFFTGHELETMRALAELIVPADDVSPGATQAGAAEFIDHLCSRNRELADTFQGGLLWMDDYMSKAAGTTFLAAKPAQQIALLDKIAYRATKEPQYAAGQRFFVWARNLVQDAFYTSPVGVKDLGFVGNGAMAEFSVPTEAVAYAIKHSPFANEG